MAIKFTFTNEDQDQRYDEPRQGYPMQRVDPTRKRTTEDRHVSLVTNDADVDLHTLLRPKSSSSTDVQGLVIAAVAGGVGFMLLEGVINMLVKAALCAAIAVFCYITFGKKKGGSHAN